MKNEKKIASSQIRTGVATLHEWYANRLRHKSVSRHFLVLPSLSQADTLRIHAYKF